MGSYGTPLSGGQRVRLCVARALYSRAKLIVLDEPLSSLDVSLARHLVTKALVPAARSGRTVLLATNRLELLHYADIVRYVYEEIAFTKVTVINYSLLTMIFKHCR